MNLWLICVILWGIVGGLNLTNNEISRQSYTVVWVALMADLIIRCFGI